MVKTRKSIPVSRLQVLLGPCLVLLALPGLLAVSGCLDEPEIDERWTLVEFLSTDPVPGQDLDADQPLTVEVAGQITYRAIRTGFLVAEVRFSDNLGPANMVLDPDDQTLHTAHQVEQILNNSITAGRGTKAVTGFDHLMQRVDFAFDAFVPSELFGGDPDSAAYRGLFLVLYLAEGEEIELEDGRDSLVVTPMPVDEFEVLYTGFVLDLLTPGSGGSK